MILGGQTELEHIMGQQTVHEIIWRPIQHSIHDFTAWSGMILCLLPKHPQAHEMVKRSSIGPIHEDNRATLTAPARSQTLLVPCSKFKIVRCWTGYKQWGILKGIHSRQLTCTHTLSQTYKKIGNFTPLNLLGYCPPWGQEGQEGSNLGTQG